jgi:hypothetical protein
LCLLVAGDAERQQIGPIITTHVTAQDADPPDKPDPPDSVDPPDSADPPNDVDPPDSADPPDGADPPNEPPF